MPYRPEWFVERIQDATLLDVALDVHMTTTGALHRDPLKQHSDIKLLEYALATWQPSTGKNGCWEDFDNAVKNLIRVAISNHYARETESSPPGEES